MRLINVHTLQFEQFFDGHTPPYAVVSHRWGEREVSYQEYTAGPDESSPGYQKIVRCAKIAQSRGRDWIWIDTNCIDKTSSAELTEAINSMFEWYKSAVECYAFLPDLTHDSDQDTMRESLRRSVYFHRGWTLQELLAPREVYFYDSAFDFFASKLDLADVLFEITGIRRKYLEDPSALQTASIAERMSWMASRHTTRIEDTAYCLLGVFGVNMPLLYGERERAFFRLQLAIIRNSDDESIYAWHSQDIKTAGMLASWPSDFANSGNIRSFAIQPEHRVPWAWGSKGMELRLLENTTPMMLQPNDPVPPGQRSKLLTLGCWNDEAGPNASDDDPSHKRLANKVVAINLERINTAWQRTDCDRMILVSNFGPVSRSSMTPMVLRHYYVPQNPPPQAGGYQW